MSDKIELTALTAWLGFNSLASVIRGWSKSEDGVDGDTFTLARTLYKALKPHAIAREEGMSLIGEQYAVMEQTMGGSKSKTDEAGNIVWKKGKEAEGRKALKALNEEAVTIEVKPLQMSKLAPKGAKVGNPGELIALEELGLVAE